MVAIRIKKRAQLLRDQSLLLEVSLYAVHLHAVLLEPENKEAKYPYLTILICYTLTPIRSAVFWSMRNGYTESKLPKTPVHKSKTSQPCVPVTL